MLAVVACAIWDSRMFGAAVCTIWGIPCVFGAVACIWGSCVYSVVQ